mgnify:CR=1 FL=1
MMPRKAPAFDLWRAGFEIGALALEAQAVIAMRMMGMAGLWPVTKSEGRRMILEKPEAFSNAAMAAAKRAIKGGRVDDVVSVATKSLTRKARANRKRLAKRAMK